MIWWSRAKYEIKLTAVGSNPFGVQVRAPSYKAKESPRSYWGLGLEVLKLLRKDRKYRQ